jgi:hypothetical protein
VVVILFSQKQTSFKILLTLFANSLTIIGKNGRLQVGVAARTTENLLMYLAKNVYLKRSPMMMG